MRIWGLPGGVQWAGGWTFALSRTYWLLRRDRTMTDCPSSSSWAPPLACRRPEDDAFAAAAPGAVRSTKHGRHAKRSARALEASYVPLDPTRQRVEEIIAAAGSGDAGASAGAPTAADVMYAADEDDAEQL